jgi:murein DD-endopeptidase MepM/ murein hydrolase activator NlpD
MSPTAVSAVLIFLGLNIACTASASEKRLTTATSRCFGSPVPGEWRISRRFHDPEYEFRRIIEHTGIDIPVPVGTGVLAPASGTVLRAGPNDEDNNIVIVETAHGLRYRVMHLSVISVRKGQRVRRGAVLGKSGGAVGAKGSGTMTTGPHLHLDADRDGAFIDPLPLFCPDAGAPQD